MYDNDGDTPARYLLPFRVANVSATAPSRPPPPGIAGRWRLPEDLSGMGGLSRMLARVNQMNSLFVIYELLQGLVLLGLMIRLIMQLSFQRRISVIGGTLVRGHSQLKLQGIKTSHHITSMDDPPSNIMPFV